tara:strand:+ start:30 stop:245 length:216 start_codon:yes stop_codon:yes gene_type:complete
MSKIEDMLRKGSIYNKGVGQKGAGNTSTFSNLNNIIKKFGNKNLGQAISNGSYTQSKKPIFIDNDVEFDED